MDQGNVVRTVNYSTMDFTVPIQKNTEREIFDYIDLKSMEKWLSEKWFTQSLRYADDKDIDDIQENEENIDEQLENEETWWIGDEENISEELNDEEPNQESMWEDEENQEESLDQVE